MSYETELANKQFQTNIVLKIGDNWYGNDQVDSDSGDIMGTGVGVPANHVGLVQNVKVNPIQFDIKSVNTTTQTLSFELLDKDAIISNEIGMEDNAFLELPVLCYAGFITGSFDFADYKLISETTTKRITKKQNVYAFESAELVSLLDAPIFDLSTALDGDVASGDTSLALIDSTGWPTSGMLRIDDEYIVFTGRSGNILTGLSRGDLSSLAADHDDGAPAFLVYQSGDINPITWLLQILVSPGGGSAYDVLDDGLGIDQSKIDIAGFEQIRTDFFDLELFRFYSHDIGKASTYIQDEILKATNMRLFSQDGKIKGAVLDQINIGGTPPVVDEDTIMGFPGWSITSDTIVNKVIINYGYSEGEDKFSRTVIATNDDSIATFGEKDAIEMSFKGIKTDLNGQTIAQNRADRLLARLSTPQSQITVSTQFDKSNLNFGETVNLVHRYLPQPGGGLGLNSQLEVISRAVDFGAGKADYKLAYTSYANLRIGLIAPSSQIDSIVDQSTFDLQAGEGQYWLAGYKVVLFNVVTNAFLPDAVNEIASVVGDTITMVNPWSSTLTTDFILRFAQYDEVSDEQKSLYAFVGYNSGAFGDGIKDYQIIY